MPPQLVILSGGMDSTTMLYLARKQAESVECISFDYGQRHRRELDMARQTCEKLGVRHDIIDITSLTRFISNSALTGDIDVPHGHYNAENMKLTIVPNRNMIMLSLAAGIAVNRGADAIWIGVHAGDHAIYPDCRPEFIASIQDTIALATGEKIRIVAPYSDQDKGDIAIAGLAMGVDYALTHTCYEGTEIPCGQCGACVERAEAFAKAGAADPLLVL